MLLDERVENEQRCGGDHDDAVPQQVRDELPAGDLLRSHEGRGVRRGQRPAEDEDLAQNELLYTIGAQLLQRKFQALKTAIKLEAPLNLRNSATVAGTLVTCDGRSTFACALLAMDAKLTVDRGPKTENGPSSTVYGLGEFLPLRPRGLITEIIIPINATFAFDYVARTPADKPIVCAALAQWSGKRARLAIGGWGKSPFLAMDGTEAEGIETAAKNACHEAADDFASAEYRMDVAATLAKRCLEAIQ